MQAYLSVQAGRGAEVMDNIYYSPEKYGVKVLGEVQEDQAWSFNKFVVWQRTSDGALFYASDSGCSCPSPFEDYTSVESLSAITKQTDKTFERDLQEWSKTYEGDLRDGVTQSNLDNLTVKVREALHEATK